MGSKHSVTKKNRNVKTKKKFVPKIIKNMAEKTAVNIENSIKRMGSKLSITKKNKNVTTKKNSEPEIIKNEAEKTAVNIENSLILMGSKHCIAKKINVTTKKNSEPEIIKNEAEKTSKNIENSLKQESIPSEINLITSTDKNISQKVLVSLSIGAIESSEFSDLEFKEVTETLKSCPDIINIMPSQNLEFLNNIEPSSEGMEQSVESCFFSDYFDNFSIPRSLNTMSRMTLPSPHFESISKDTKLSEAFIIDQNQLNDLQDSSYIIITEYKSESNLTNVSSDKFISYDVSLPRSDSNVEIQKEISVKDNLSEELINFFDQTKQDNKEGNPLSYIDKKYDFLKENIEQTNSTIVGPSSLQVAVVQGTIYRREVYGTSKPEDGSSKENPIGTEEFVITKRFQYGTTTSGIPEKPMFGFDCGCVGPGSGPSNNAQNILNNASNNKPGTSQKKGQKKRKKTQNNGKSKTKGKKRTNETNGDNKNGDPSHVKIGVGTGYEINFKDTGNMNLKIEQVVGGNNRTFTFQSGKGNIVSNLKKPIVMYGGVSKTLDNQITMDKLVREEEKGVKGKNGKPEKKPKSILSKSETGKKGEIVSRIETKKTNLITAKPDLITDKPVRNEYSPKESMYNRTTLDKKSYPSIEPKTFSKPKSTYEETKLQKQIWNNSPKTVDKTNGYDKQTITCTAEVQAEKLDKNNLSSASIPNIKITINVPRVLMKQENPYESRGGRTETENKREIVVDLGLKELGPEYLAKRNSNLSKQEESRDQTLQRAKSQANTSDQTLQRAQSRLDTSDQTLQRAKFQANTSDQTLQRAQSRLDASDQTLQRAKSQANTSDQTLQRAKSQANTSNQTLQSAKSRVYTSDQTLQRAKSRVDTNDPTLRSTKSYADTSDQNSLRTISSTGRPQLNDFNKQTSRPKIQISHDYGSYDRNELVEIKESLAKLKQNLENDCPCLATRERDRSENKIKGMKTNRVIIIHTKNKKSGESDSFEDCLNSCQSGNIPDMKDRANQDTENEGTHDARENERTHGAKGNERTYGAKENERNHAAKVHINEGNNETENHTKEYRDSEEIDIIKMDSDIKKNDYESKIHPITVSYQAFEEVKRENKENNRENRSGKLEKGVEEQNTLEEEKITNQPASEYNGELDEDIYEKHKGQISQTSLVPGRSRKKPCRDKSKTRPTEYEPGVPEGVVIVKESSKGFDRSQSSINSQSYAVVAEQNTLRIDPIVSDPIERKSNKLNFKSGPRSSVSIEGVSKLIMKSLEELQDAWHHPDYMSQSLGLETEKEIKIKDPVLQIRDKNRRQFLREMANTSQQKDTVWLHPDSAYRTDMGAHHRTRKTEERTKENSEDVVKEPTPVLHKNSPSNELSKNKPKPKRRSQDFVYGKKYSASKKKTPSPKKDTSYKSDVNIFNVNILDSEVRSDSQYSTQKVVTADEDSKTNVNIINQSPIKNFKGQVDPLPEVKHRKKCKKKADKEKVNDQPSIVEPEVKHRKKCKKKADKEKVNDKPSIVEPLPEVKHRKKCKKKTSKDRKDKANDSKSKENVAETSGPIEEKDIQK